MIHNWKILEQKDAEIKRLQSLLDAKTEELAIAKNKLEMVKGLISKVSILRPIPDPLRRLNLQDDKLYHSRKITSLNAKFN